MYFLLSLPDRKPTVLPSEEQRNDTSGLESYTILNRPAVRPSTLKTVIQATQGRCTPGPHMVMLAGDAERREIQTAYKRCQNGCPAGLSEGSVYSPGTLPCTTFYP